MRSELARLASSGHAEALAARGELARLAWEARRAAPGAVWPDAESWKASLLAGSVSLTLLAGSGSRWLRSLEAARGSPAAAGFDPARPRGLFPVADHLGRGGGRIPVAAYALDATRGLGRHVLVVRGWRDEIATLVISPLGIPQESCAFVEQEAPFGKPLGHGDAAWQARALWRDADYVVCNFGGDANSRITVEVSLMALDALRASGEEVELLLPAAPLERPAYPIRLDAGGLPRGFGHAKLEGRGEEGPEGPGYANVGIRVYRAAALAAALEGLRARWWREGEGYAVPGNDPAGRELALDNADSFLAASGAARMLAFARPEELRPAKCLEDLPAFEAAVASVVDEYRRPAG